MSRVKINGKNADPLHPSARGEALDSTHRPPPAASVKISSAKLPNADSLDFSTRAATIGKLVETALGLPGIRYEQIEPLRTAIASGTYRPPARDIANAILKD